MPNINKVVFGSATLIDLTISTLDNANQIVQGVTAVDRGGNLLTGTYVAPTYDTYYLWRDTNGVVRIATSDPSQETGYAESIIVYAEQSQAAIVGTAVVGTAIVG